DPAWSGTPPYPATPTSDRFAASAPTSDELRRWEAFPVVRFRRKLAPYLFVNAVIVVASIVGGSDFFFFTVLWSIYLAFKYAKLWADGYDWRDVFRQPRDRDLVDVADDFLSYVRALFDPGQRRAMREQRRERRLQRGAQPALPAGAPVPFADTSDVAQNDRIRRAQSDRDEILRMLSRMSSAERSRIPDVGRSAEALFERVHYLSASLAELERNGGSNSDALEAEIARLENAANPLDEAGSEERVRRLAYLKRQRRALSDVGSRRDLIAAKLDTCVLALQNMKFDLVRLNAGSQTAQHITSLAMDALNLASSVDNALGESADPGRTSGARAASRQAAR
ncbi:MAG: hypothetical protein ACREMU_03280, partial [Gemmatimonadaceae bacterium]